MLRLYGILVFLLAALMAQAQQLGQYSMYALNPVQINPAYAGLEGTLNFTGVFRSQWAGLERNPVSQNFTAELPMDLLRGGLGVIIENETLGAQQALEGRVVYSYHTYIGNAIIGIGVGGGLSQNNLDGQLIRTPDGNYEGGTIDHADAQLPIIALTAQRPLLEAGVFFMSERFQAGVSAKNLLNVPLDYTVASISPSKTYFLTLGGTLDIGRSFALLPSILLKTDLLQTQLDGTLLVQYNENIWAGAAYRGYDANSTDALAIILGAQVSEKIKIAYAYDLTLSGLNRITSGSHEFLINYNLNKPVGKGRLPNIIYNPRGLD